MENVKAIVITKNRGWRGLSEVRCINDNGVTVNKMIFSFSQPVWDDMQHGYIVVQDESNYYIIHFTGTDRLPKGQRSVLIKSFLGDVMEVTTIKKDKLWDESYETRHFVSNFLNNRNNHTTSDWNCIGIRVTPSI